MITRKRSSNIPDLFFLGSTAVGSGNPSGMGGGPPGGVGGRGGSISLEGIGGFSVISSISGYSSSKSTRPGASGIGPFIKTQF